MNLILCDGIITTGLNGEALCSVAWSSIDATNTILLVNGGFEPEAFTITFWGGFWYGLQD
jgi:hypothetical protein